LFSRSPFLILHPTLLLQTNLIKYPRKSIRAVRWVADITMDARNIDSYYSKLRDAARHNFRGCSAHAPRRSITLKTGRRDAGDEGKLT